MDLQRLNQTILANQENKLTPERLQRALLASGSPQQSLERRRLALACELTDLFPMSICTELAEALLPDPSALLH
jgi:hypothetical protein